MIDGYFSDYDPRFGPSSGERDTAARARRGQRREEEERNRRIDKLLAQDVTVPGRASAALERLYGKSTATELDRQIAAILDRRH